MYLRFAVFRYPVRGKWFGLLLEIPRSKLDIIEAEDKKTPF